MNLDPRELRDRLMAARLMLIFTPELCAGRDPLELLEALAGVVDVVQVRPKGAGKESGTEIATDPAAAARATFELALEVIDLLSGLPDPPLVLVNDRVDVAMTLAERGCAGVHLGQTDFPPVEARRLLGETPLIGLSTHDLAQVVRAGELPVDYLGFGPIWATSSKGYSRGVGPEAAWVAGTGSALPLFPIGGIDATRAEELKNVGRAAVGSGLLAAEDPLRAAREIVDLLRG